MKERQHPAIIIPFLTQPIIGDKNILSYNAQLNQRILKERFEKLHRAEKVRIQVQQVSRRRRKV